MICMIKDVLEGKMKGEVKLRGWIYRKREQKDIIFIILRDSSGIIQLACKGIKDADKASLESSIEINGKVKKDERAPGGFEVEVKKMSVPSCSFLIHAKEEVVGQQKLQILQDHFDVRNVSTIKHGILWQFTSETMTRDELIEKILATHVIQNPYAHDCYQYQIKY